jgi:hypothetical protein
MNRDNPRRRLVRPTGILADRKRERDELTRLIDEWWLDVGRVPDLARRILDAGYRRVVVDDAMVERARQVLAPLLASTIRVADFPEHIREFHRDPSKWSDFTDRGAKTEALFLRAALSAALDQDRA